MKTWIWIPLAAVAGLVAGSWGPREDLRLLRERMQEERATKKVSATAGFDAFARLANIPDVARRRPEARTNAVVAAQKTLATTNAAAEAEKPAAEEKPRRHRPRMSPEDLRARIDEAAELWRTRVELATAQWKERLNVTDEAQSASFDSAVNSMNEALREAMQAMADEIEASGRMTPELGLRLMGDVSRVMAETYDAVGAAVPADRRAEVSEMPVYEFVDPTVAEPLIGVQDKLEAGLPMPPRGGR